MPPAAQGDALDAVVRKIGELAEAGVDWIQIREKDLHGGTAARLVRESLKRVASGRSTTQILINDRLDVALAEGAGGVHLGENSLAVEQARLLIERGVPEPGSARKFLAGASAHSLAGATTRTTAGADYIFFGPVFSTPSKAAFGEPQGLERLAEVCNAVKVPVLAIGGISLDNADACLRAGAAGIAAIRLFQDAENPAGVVRRLRERTA